MDSPRPRLAFRAIGSADDGFGTLTWVDWFNHRRLLEPIGNIPPAEAEASYHRPRAGLAKAA